jgi:molybdopterin synthase catalytic subunit
MESFSISERAPDLPALIAAVALPEHGAVASFLGVVRKNSGETAVAGLDYSAYTEMALNKMAAIAAEMRERFGPLRVAAEHRVGRLAVGDVSLALAVGAPHRAQAFAAAAYFVDRLKEIVPIWKEDIPSEENQ